MTADRRSSRFVATADEVKGVRSDVRANDGVADWENVRGARWRGNHNINMIEG